MKLSYFNNVREKSNKEISITDAYNIIANGKLQKATESIRNEADKDKRNELKVSLLPAVTVSGTFKNGTHRAADLKEHSGLMQIDIDNCPADLLSGYKENLKADKYTNCCFVSPSGNGLKCIVKVEPSKEKHTDIFRALEKYYKDTYGYIIDTKTKDISRLMFLCSDKDIYINENSERFKTPEPKKQKPQQNKIQQYDNNTLADIEKVVSQIESRKIDITVNYDNWLNVGFALADVLGSAGADYFHRISRFYPDYNFEKAQEQFDKCLKNHKNNGISPFFALAKQYGLDITPAKKTAHKPKNKPKTKDKPTKDPAENDLLKPIDLNSKDIDKDLEQYGFYIKENCYYFRNHSRNKNVDYEVSNFAIRVLYHLDSNNGIGKYIFQLTNKQNETKIFDITKEDFVNINKFRAEVEPDYLFWGNQKELYRIKMQIFSDIKTAIEINILGYQPEYNIYAFSNGILTDKGNFIEVDKYGVVRYNEHDFYLPAFSEINKNKTAYVHIRKFVYQTSDITLKKYFELQQKAHGFNGVFSAIFDIASFFSDIVFFENGFFPYLYKFGVKGTGKSEHSTISQSLYGKPLQPLNLEGASTEKAYARRLAQLRNAINVLEEYTNNISNNMVGFLKGAFNRIGYDRATTTNDNNTFSTEVLSAIIILGNDMPTKKSALFERIILLNYIKGTKHNPHSENAKKAWAELELYAKKGLGGLLKELFVYRASVKEYFKPAFNNVRKLLKHDYFKDVPISTRTINNIAAVLAPFYILKDRLNIDFGIDNGLFTEQLIKNISRHNNLLSRVDEINIFWQALEYLSGESEISNGADYMVKRNEENKNVLYLRFNAVYPKYKQYCIKQNINSLDDAALIENLKSGGAFIQSNLKDRDTTKQRFNKKLKDAYMFDFDKLPVSLEL